ncbi:MAG TPA: DUF308 domain-containing protein [Acidimicrobiia bacterium]
MKVEMTDQGPRLDTNWWVPLVFGLISVGLGIWLFLYPNVAVQTVAIILAIDIIIFGVVLIMAGFAVGSGVAVTILLVIAGVLSIVAGAMLLTAPQLQRAETVVFVAGLFFLFTGVIETVSSLFRRVEGWGWTLLAGILSIVAGVLVLNNEIVGAITIAFLFASWMIVMGVVRIAMAFQMRAGEKEVNAQLAAG